MEVNESYIKFLLKLLKSDDNIDFEQVQEELKVNLYLTLLSLSNTEFTEELEQKENEILSDFLRKLNNLKVKIQLKRKKEETQKLVDTLVTQYYEDINILSLYIKDGNQLENIIKTLDPKELTKIIDKVTKLKMNKEDKKEERTNQRTELIQLLPDSNYYIKENKIYIETKEIHKSLSINDFLDTFSYLLLPDNYNKLYSNKNNQKSHELIITNIIKFLSTKEKTKEDIKKVLVPTIITFILSLNINEINNLDTSDFNIENIKITELYSLAKEEQSINDKTPKWRNISIPNEFLINKLKDMIKQGMYYYNEDTFILEKIENKISDFKVSINEDKIKIFLTGILESTI